MITFYLYLVDKVGDTSSVIGMFISLYVLFEVNRIKNKFLFKARLPQLIKSLKDNAKVFSGNLQNFEDSSRDIETNLSKTISTLKNIKYKISGVPKKDTINLLKKINKRTKPITKDYLWDIYNDLQALIDSLGYLTEDTKWSQ